MSHIRNLLGSDLLRQERVRGLMQWYLLLKRRHVGPFTKLEIREKVLDGQISSHDFLIAEENIETGDFHYRHVSDVLDMTKEEIEVLDSRNLSSLIGLSGSKEVVSQGQDYEAKISKEFSDQIEAIDLVGQSHSSTTEAVEIESKAELNELAPEEIEKPLWIELRDQLTSSKFQIGMALFGCAFLVSIWAYLDFKASPVPVIKTDSLSQAVSSPQIQAPPAKSRPIGRPPEKSVRDDIEIAAPAPAPAKKILPDANVKALEPVDTDRETAAKREEIRKKRAERRQNIRDRAASRDEIQDEDENDSRDKDYGFDDSEDDFINEEQPLDEFEEDRDIVGDDEEYLD